MVVLALFLLPALSCTPAGPPPAAEVIDLLERRPAETPAPDGLVPAESQSWDFNRGLPEGWSAGPPGVSVHLEDDGVRLEHPDQLPWLELRCGEGIDPLRYGRINALVRPLGATDAALYYSFSDPARYQRNLVSRVKYKLDETRLAYGLGFPGIDGFESDIRVLRLYPALTGGSAVVCRVALWPRQPEYLAGHVLSREWVPLDQQYRRCWRLVGPGQRQVSLDLPGEPAVLRFAAASLIGERPVSINAELETGSGVVHRLAAEGALESGGGWQEFGADLAEWAGERVTLRIRVEGGDPGTVTLIGSPALLPRVPDEEWRQPNVLLIMVDTLRADRLSAYGSARRISPHLDRLARKGVLFSSAFAPSSWTLPSVAALLTGQYPGELEIGTGKQLLLPAGAPTLAEGFARAGYDTAGFSANCILDPFQGYSRGFDAFYLATYKDYSMTAGQLNRRALDWLSRRGERPFFCYLQYMDPHSPYAPPGTDRHPDSNAATFIPRQVGGYRAGDIYPLVMGNETFDPADNPEDVAAFYDDEVAYVDHQIGRLLADLTRRGLLEDTVVAVVADHGEELHDRGFWSHGFTLYQEQLHVPLILSLPPGMPSPPAPAGGLHIRTPVSLVDLFPTLFDLAGLEPGGEPAGRNIFAAPEERGLISETWTGGVPPRFCLRQGPYKYVVFNRQAAGAAEPEKNPGRWIWQNGPAAEELYNLEEDPGERHNLAAQLPEVAQRMRRELELRFGMTAVNAGGGKAEKMDLDTEERLRALGYIE